MKYNIEDAIVDEEQREPFEFVWDGRDYSLPPALDIGVLAYIEREELFAGMQKLFGAEQWEALVASPTMMSNARLMRLWHDYIRYVTGQPVGESSASTGSSKSTVRPSKRTSNGSTKSRSGRSAKA